MPTGHIIVLNGTSFTSCPSWPPVAGFYIIAGVCNLPKHYVST